MLTPLVPHLVNTFWWSPSLNSRILYNLSTLTFVPGPESIKESRILLSFTLLSFTLFSRPSMSRFVQGEGEVEGKVDHTCAVINVRFNGLIYIILYLCTV